MASAQRRARDTLKTHDSQQRLASLDKDESSFRKFISPRNRSLRFQLLLLLLSSLIASFIYYRLISGYTSPHHTLTEPFYNKTMVQFSTKYGNFTIDLYPAFAPKTVETFMKLIDSGFYSKEAGFYRNEPNFVLQGGGYLFNKTSSIGTIPVEYSLPSTERAVVMTRKRNGKTQDSDFAIMLHDNTELNRPNDKSPGYTTFGRVVQGWYTISRISKLMPAGYLSRSQQHKQVSFTQVEYIKCLTNDDSLAKARLEELHDAIETPYTAVIFAQPDCTEATQIATTLHEMHALYRLVDIEDSNSHLYERETLAAMSGYASLPLVYIDQHWIPGLDQFNKELQISLRKRLQISGALAQPFAWSVIQDYPLVVFSKSYCPYCKKAKTLLTSLGAEPFVVELDLRSDGAAIQDFLYELTDQSTVPNIFIRQVSIGGSDNAQKLYDSGELKDKLQKAQVIQ